MKSKWRVVLTLVLIFTLVLISSMGSLAFAKDRIQARDRDCIDEPNHQYCDLTECDCDCDQDQLRLREYLNDGDCDCIKDRLQNRLMNWDFEKTQYRLRMSACLMQYLFLNVK